MDTMDTLDAKPIFRSKSEIDFRRPWRRNSISPLGGKAAILTEKEFLVRLNEAYPYYGESSTKGCMALFDRLFFS